MFAALREVFGWPDLFLGLAVVLAGLAGAVLLRSRESRPPDTREIALGELAACWTKSPVYRTVHIADLVHLWRDERLARVAVEPLAVAHPRAAAFLRQLDEWPFFRTCPEQGAVCRQLVQLLDREGDCPSVVDVRGDVEAAWEANTYRLLAQTTLLDHSLDVAEQVVRLLADNQAWHVIPDTLVAALAHDLGKLPSARGTLYALGEHPLAAGTVLAGVPGFKELGRKDEILRAIKLHHKVADGLLGKTLKQADQLARQQELEEAMAAGGLQEEEGKEGRTELEGGAARQGVKEIFAETTGPEVAREEKPRPLDISRWFDAAGFLALLKPVINRLDGRRFLAFSMADGLVYFQVKALEQAARQQAERAGCMEIATMAADDPTMRRVLFAVVQRLRQEPEVIARHLIRDSYFGGYFLLTRKFGKELRGYYTPFHAECFGSIAEMERAKPDLLRDIVKVTPWAGEERRD